MAVWDPSEQYDPLHPNDYTEFKLWKQKDRIDRRERLAEERRTGDRKRYRRGSSYTDSEHSGSDDDRPRKSGKLCTVSFEILHFLHLVGRYEEHYDRWSRMDDSNTSTAGSRHVPPSPQEVAAVVQDMSGEEAFQRRLAISAGAGVRSPPSLQLPNEDKDNSQGALPSHGAVETGDEAYLRRVALSQAQAQGSPAHPPVANLPSPPPAQPDSPPTLAYNPFAPRPVPPPPSGPPPDAFADRAKAAAAIAAKLGALAAAAGAGSPSGSASPAPPTNTLSEASSSTKYAFLTSTFPL